jgi:hypothetical protein
MGSGSEHLTGLASYLSPAEAAGLRVRGAFHPVPEDGVPGLPDGTAAGTVLMLGFVGSDGFARFQASPEAADGLPHPLDRWSRRVVGALAQRFGAMPLFPFEGPPWFPFQRWAARAEPVHPSPIGTLIHPDWGLWHSWRGAIALRERLELPPPDERGSPCLSCPGKPCLDTCPVNAFSPTGFDIAACVAHLSGPAGVPCMTNGCLARRACPVGSRHAQAPAHAAFTMAAFLATHGGPQVTSTGSN